jgi:hypothetical protein
MRMDLYSEDIFPCKIQLADGSVRIIQKSTDFPQDQHFTMLEGKVNVGTSSDDERTARVSDSK